MLDLDRPKTKTELRNFGFVMAAAFLIISSIAFWKDNPIGIVFLSISVVFAITGLIYPSMLRPLEKAWMKLAYYLSIVMTTVILSLVYYLILTPIGLVMRMLGKDLLKKKLDRSQSSYWEPVHEDGPGSRPFKPF